MAYRDRYARLSATNSNALEPNIQVSAPTQTPSSLSLGIADIIELLQRLLKSTDLVDMPKNLVANKWLRVSASGRVIELVDGPTGDGDGAAGPAGPAGALGTKVQIGLAFPGSPNTGDIFYLL